MSTVVREDLSVTIPHDMAQALGIHGGSTVEWASAPQGGLLLRRTEDRKSAVKELDGMLRSYVRADQSGVESFLDWRDEERRLEDRP